VYATVLIRRVKTGRSVGPKIATDRSPDAPKDASSTGINSMASRRPRPASAAAEQLLGARHHDVPAVGEGRPDAAPSRHYRLLFERAPLPYVVTDYDGTIRAANRAAAVLLKRPSELLAGQPLAAFVPLERRGEFRETLAGLPLLDGVRDWRLTLVPHAGAPVEVAVHANVLDGAWEGGDAIFWIVRPRRPRAAD
jgi:PAS domain S-box-containing protein